MKKKELKDLKPGDKVLLRERWGDSIVTVIRMTKTQIVTNKNERFRIADGWRVGGGSGIISIPTEKDCQRIKEAAYNRAINYKLDRIDFHTLPIDKKERILKIAKE